MAGFGIARKLPGPLRRMATRIDAAYQIVRPPTVDLSKLRPRRPYRGDDVAVIGIFKSRSGIGRGGQLIALGLEKAGARVTRVDVTDQMGIPQAESSLACISLDECLTTNPTDVVLVLNPPLFVDALLRLGAEWVSERSIVAHWVWELDVLPRPWRFATRAADEVWASSEFVADAVRNSVPHYWGPIKTVPYPVDLDPLPKGDRSLRSTVRARLGIDRDAFVAGYSFAATSNFTRKNPEAAIEAFQMAFPAGQDNVALILRCLDMAIFPAGRERLVRAAAGDRRIIILDDASGGAPSLGEFYASIDAYLAPSRSEGYGLNLVEASQLGLPVIATRWSLSSDILSRPNIFTVDSDLVAVKDPQHQYAFMRTARWAEPKRDQLAACLRRVRQSQAANRETLSSSTP